MSQAPKSNFLEFQKKRLKELRAKLGLTQEQMGQKMGVSGNYVWMLERPAGEKNFSKKILEKLDLLEVESKNIDRPAPSVSLPEATAEGPTVIIQRRFIRQVPVVSWAAAGTAHDYSDLCVQIEETIESDCSDPNAFALILEGDSMEPLFLAGDRVVFAPNSEPRNGSYVVARYREGHGVLFKKFFRTGEEGQIVRLESLNPAYKLIERPARDFRFIYPAYDMKRLLR